MRQDGEDSGPSLQELVEQLPPEAQQEVHDFVEFLLEKKRRRQHQALRLTWAGALREYRDQFTSLALQKKAAEWWGG